jgi:hypothetical protein
VKHDTSRILMPFLIHYGISNCPYVGTESPAGSDDENSHFPFSNRKDILEKIWLVEFGSCWYDVEYDSSVSGDESRCQSFLRSDGVPRPWNNICRRPCKPF